MLPDLPRKEHNRDLSPFVGQASFKDAHVGPSGTSLRFRLPANSSNAGNGDGYLTGKSKVAIDLIVNRGHKRVLILCPKSVVSVWPYQLALHAPSSVRAVPLTSGKVADKKAVAAEALSAARPTDTVVVIINYESAYRAPFNDWALSPARQWDCVILDESHRIKAPGGKQSWFCKALSKRARQRLCLTGTPMPHSPLDIYAQYRFLAPEIFGTSFTVFKSRYSIPHPVFPGQIKALIHQDELAEKYQSVAFRVTKEEALDLPDVEHVNVPVILEKKTRKAYDELEEDFWTSVDAGEVTAGNALVKLLRLQQITSGFTVLDDDTTVTELGAEKYEALRDILEGLPDGEPFVAFAKFRHDLDMIHAACRSLGLTSSELSGRANNLMTWQQGDTQVLGCQIQAGGVGVDMVRASHVCFVSMGFSLGDYEQALARSHRPGQTEKVTYYHLVAKQTVDEKVYETLRERKNVVEAIMSGRAERPLTRIS